MLPTSRYHLVVRAFREIIAAIGTYNSKCKGMADDMRKLCGKNDTELLREYRHDLVKPTLT